MYFKRSKAREAWPAKGGDPYLILDSVRVHVHGRGLCCRFQVSEELPAPGHSGDGDLDGWTGAEWDVEGCKIYQDSCVILLA